jgi:outer membrane lipoprotein SlyB
MRIGHRLHGRHERLRQHGQFRRYLQRHADATRTDRASVPFGALGGGALGAVAGSAIGGGRGSILTGIIGGIAGAVAGNEVQGRMDRHNGLEITVRLANGDLRAITQADDGQMFYAGQQVRLLSSGGITRVTV